MKSKTSSCKKTALRKDLTRFLPVWAGYILCLLLIQIAIASDDLSFWYASNLGESIALMGLVNCGYALIAAQMLFGDLFHTRMCNGLHSLPLKREHWFSAHIRAGLLFSLIPTAVMLPLSEAIIYCYSDMVNGWQIPLYWWVNTNLQYLFFFGLAVFCAMCAGNRFAMTVVYGIVNFFSILIYFLVAQIYVPMLRGVVATSDLSELLCPMWQIISTRFITSDRRETGRTYLDHWGVEQKERIGTFTVQYESWIYVFILAALGILLLLVARQMYKKRRLECAGDFLAVRWLEAPFQVVFTVLCAAGFQGVFSMFFGYNSDNTYLILGIGLLTGWFAGRMFLERSTRVFRFKNILGLAVMAALMAGSLYITTLDPLGIENWVPKQEQVEKVSFTLSHRSAVGIEDPEEIRDILRLHSLAIEEDVNVHPDYSDVVAMTSAEDYPAAYVRLDYTLRNGLHAVREYYIHPDTEAGDIAREYGGSLMAVVRRSGITDAATFRKAMRNVDEVYVSGHKMTAEQLTEDFLLSLADAIVADCSARTLVQSDVYHPEPFLDAEDPNDVIRSVYLEMNGLDFFCYLNVYADSENTMEVLKTTGILDKIGREELKYYAG